MKTTTIISIGALIGTSLIAGAQDKPKRQPGERGTPPPAILEKFDKDGDGKLNDEERATMREEGKARMEERRKEMLKKFDTDGDGKLSPDERKKAMEERHAEMLKKFDKDGDGKLSEEERAAMPKPPRGKGEGRPGGRDGKAGKPEGPKADAE